MHASGGTISKVHYTINTHEGLYRYTRVPFGISCAPAKFQKAMEQVIQGLDGVGVYINDLLVTGETMEKHLQNLSAVFTRLEEHVSDYKETNVISFNPW